MKRSLSLLLLALLSCAPAATPPAVAPAPVQRPVATAQRVVLLSFDGLGADALARQTGLPAFERLANESASARIIPVTPTSTVPAHVAILTGAGPEKTGIVANRFHLPGTPPEQETRGIAVDPEVESIIEAARRQGKRVGAVPFPTIDGQTPRRTADFGLAWSDVVTPGRVITLKRDDFKREWVPPGWTPRPQRRQSFSPVMRARLEWAVGEEVRIDVDLVAFDLTNDAVENYDSIFLESGDFEAVPDAAGWFPISMRVNGALHGSWSKLLRADAKLNDVAVYWGPVNRNQAWPESFAALVDEHAGFWPGEPDERLDSQTFIEQNNRLTDYLTRAQTAAMQRMQFDLLLLYQPAIDKAAHPFLNRNDAVVRDAFAAADRAMTAIRQLTDPARDAFIVTGDHGLMPREREIRMNALLPPGWRAFANGHVAHIYGSGDAEAVVRMLTATGYFERIERRFHPNAGDIVVYAHPANVLTPSSEQPAVVERQGGGQHGALNAHRELHTVLFAIAPGVERVPLGEIEQTKIARFVASLLGITPPAAAE